VAGLISYLYNSDHFAVIEDRWYDEVLNDLNWVRTVRNYVKELSWERMPSKDEYKVNVVYNGENPDLISSGAPACRISGQISRRQNGTAQNHTAHSCVLNKPQSTSSTSTVALPTSIKPEPTPEPPPPPPTPPTAAPIPRITHHTACRYTTYTHKGEEWSKIIVYSDYGFIRPGESLFPKKRIFPDAKGHGGPDDKVFTSPQDDPVIGTKVSGIQKGVIFTFTPTQAAHINMDGLYTKGADVIFKKWNEWIWDSEIGEVPRLFDICPAPGLGFMGGIDPRFLISS
jgi:hypothetical protein